VKGWLVAAALVIGLFGCSRSDPVVQGATDGAGSKLDFAEAERSHIVAVPISRPREPDDFPGNDGDLIRAFEVHVTHFEVAQKPSEQSVIEYAREFCSVLSGGGLLAEKVNGWGGASRIPTDVDVPVFLAALDVYCAEYAQEYANVRAEGDKVEPSESELADLVRFFAGLPGTVGVSKLEAIPDEEILLRSENMCSAPGGFQALSPSAIRQLTESVPRSSQRGFAGGLVMIECPERVEELRAWLGAATG